MRLAAKRVQFARDWRPLEYKLYATGRQSHALLLSGQLRAKPPVFVSTLREQLFELKNEDAIKNLRIYATYVRAKAYPLTLCMARSHLVRQFL
jgi:hypothetical protein